MGQARVSTIIPTYNCAAHLAAAVESVLAQSYRSFEIIVVDDGSTDQTQLVLNPYRDRIQYVYQENKGEPAARNSGLQVAKGDYIAFLDADDLWLPEKLELQMKYFDDHADCGLVYTDMKIFDERGIAHESVKTWLGMSPPSGDVFLHLFQETLFCPGAAVFRRECAEKVGPFDETFIVGCDYEMWLRMARHFRFGYVDRPLLMYRQHAAQATRSIGRTLIEGIPWELRVLKKIVRLYPEITEELGEAAVRKRFAKVYFYLGCGELDQQNGRQAGSYFAHAVRLWPTNWRFRLFLLATFLPPSQLAWLRRLRHRLARLLSAAGSAPSESRGHIA